MPSLDPDAVEHMWPFVQLLGAAVVLLMFTAAGLWGGFRWLKGQIKETAKDMLAPVAEKAMRADAKAAKAHKRISRVREDLGLPPDHYDEFETSP